MDPSHQVSQGAGPLLKFPKIPEVPLIDNRPTKNVKIEKVGLFDLLPTDILKIINDWSISFKYNDKPITAVKGIVEKNPVPLKLIYTELKPFHNFGPLKFYGTTRYEWAHRHYMKNWITFETNMHLNKNKPV